MEVVVVMMVLKVAVMEGRLGLQGKFNGGQVSYGKVNSGRGGDVRPKFHGSSGECLVAG